MTLLLAAVAVGSIALNILGVRAFQRIKWVDIETVCDDVDLIERCGVRG